MYGFESRVNIKSEAEIAIMREAGRLNRLTLEAVKAAIAPGVTTAELNEVAESFQRRHGVYSPFKDYDPGNGVPFPGSICTSINEVLYTAFQGSASCKRVISSRLIAAQCTRVLLVMRLSQLAWERSHPRHSI